MSSFLSSGSVKVIYFTVPVLFPSETTVSLTGPDGLEEVLLEELLELLLEEELLDELVEVFLLLPVTVTSMLPP